jgi:transcription-repair coupling factor (superfamily II helicase)
VIETPPRDRLAIQTNVIKFDPQVIGQAIRTELSRGGQVYVVHNRVESIHSVASLVARMVPEARLAVAHGQTTEAALEKVMIEFVAHEYDVLIATTIIENGLDIPNVNTIVINHAEKYGLAQLYQLRGRVGRSDRRAYAYLVIPADNVLTPVARQRLSAIREFSELGSGFRVAALDLEIRGAGNLLGGQQSGHIEAIGFDMYVKLLQQAVQELQGNEIEDTQRARVNLGVELRIDETYVVETNQRLVIYRKIAEADNEMSLKEVMDEVRDRYGSMHASVERLADYARVRILSDRIGIEAIDREGPLLVVRFRADAELDLEQLVKFVGATESATLSPEGVIRVNLDGADRQTDARRVKVKNQGLAQVSVQSQSRLVDTKPLGLEGETPENKRFTSDQAYLSIVQTVLRQLSGSG